MPSRSTSSTEPPAEAAGRPVLGRPVLGRPSPAAAGEPALGPAGGVASAGWRADGASTEWCTIRAASVVGVRHRLAGLGPEDSYAWMYAADRLAVAVADGVGSEPGSAATAERAGYAAVQAAATTYGGDGTPVGGEPEEAVRAGIAAADRAAQGGGATTLVVAVVDHDGSGAIGRVGDSSAWLLDADGVAQELFDPPDPERADTATAALPASGAEPEMRSFSACAGSVLVLVTDGVADPWRDGPTTVAPALTAALRNRPDPVELLSLVDFSRQGCHDDRTLVGVWLR